MTETIDTEVTTERNSRSAETRETQTRRKPWQPPSMLDAPNAPLDMHSDGSVNQQEEMMTNRICQNVFEKVMNL